MNKTYEYIDLINKKINSMSIEQLEKIDMKYLGSKRVGNFLIMSALFDTVFLAKLNEYSSSFNRIEYANKIFVCYAVVVINLNSNTYSHHRMYGFPVYTQLYGANNVNSKYKEVQTQIENGDMKIKMSNDCKIRSAQFEVTKPFTNIRSSSYEVRVNVDKTLHLDIDGFVENHVKIEGNGYLRFNDPYYNYTPTTREQITKALVCTCVEEASQLRYACKCDNRATCKGFHAKKCNCGNFTYYRKNNCLKCHIQYSKSYLVRDMFDGDNSMSFGVGGNTLNSYIPYFHYNQGTSGLCLGNGGRVINDMITKNINPIRIMLSFKANLAYTDADTTTNFYESYRDRLSSSMLNGSGEYNSYLNHIMGKIPRKHLFSIYCYCQQCLYYKILLVKAKKKLDPRAVMYDNGYVISRMQFIEKYKAYLSTSRSKTYHKSYIHEMIKNVVNTPPKELILLEHI